MPQISLTDFVDYTASSGSPKLTKVKTVKDRGEYNPAFDFWRRFREGIVEHHRSGNTDKKALNQITTNQTDQKKLTAYPRAIDGYKKFLGRRSVAWFEPVVKRWSSGGLEVRINPELGLEINGVRHLIKLYLKADPLSKRRVDVILALMHEVLSEESPPNTVYAVLDVPRAKLYTTDTAAPGLLPLLHGEAISFAVIWDSLP